MKLSHLEIENFRCFYRYSIEFSNRITVLYGLNGAGKSTLIHAICKSLGFLMTSDKTTGETKSHSLASGVPGLYVEGYSSQGDFYLASASNREMPDADITLKAAGSIGGQPLEWAMSAKSNGGNLRKGQFINAFRTFWNYFQTTDFLPVLAYYSDGFPHIEDKRKVSEKVASLRNFGYYDWNNEEACCKIWLERLERTLRETERQERMVAKGVQPVSEQKLQDLHKERKEITDIFKTFTSGDEMLEVTMFGLGTYDNKLCVYDARGKEHSFRQLPAGYKRMFYIVLDIAYRSYILNKTSDARGIVVIDEIDLHLHPSLEKVILNRLSATFPHLQIIVSTHSPLVITSLETATTGNVVYRMEPRQSEPKLLHDVYGLDYNSGLEDVMGVSAKEEHLENLLSLCAFLTARGHDGQADVIRQQIVSDYAKQPDWIDAQLRSRIESMQDAVH